MKIGIFGGTFNPIHNAHMYLAQRFYDEMKLDKLLIIPTFIPPHKSADNLADAEHRLEMCRLAVLGHSGFEISGYEISQGGKSYTYRTLKHFSEAYADAEFYLLMGGDMFLTLQEWSHPEEIYKMAVLCVAGREEGELSALSKQVSRLEREGARCVLLDIKPLPLSSTKIRADIRAGRDVSDLIDLSVFEYIRTHKLYE